MADEKSSEGADHEEGAQSSTADPPGSVRIPFIVSGVLIALFVIGGIVFKKDSSTPKPFKTEGSRAVVLPAADRKRTVVVPPCSPPTVITPDNASSQISVPGSVAVAIPQGAPSRIVVVPRCGAKAAPMPGSPNRPSAAFVLGPEEQVSDQDKVPKGGNPIAYGIKHQVTIAPASPITTIVAPQCDTKTPQEKITILKPVSGSETVAVADRC